MKQEQEASFYSILVRLKDSPLAERLSLLQTRFYSILVRLKVHNPTTRKA